jgi:TonB family protein
MLTRLLLIGVLIAANAGAQPGDTRPQGSDLLITDEGPSLKTWAPAYFPPAFAKEKHSVRVEVRLVVDQKGQVTQAKVLTPADPRLEQAALAEIKKWGFKPAIEGGKPTMACVDAAVEFLPASAARDSMRSKLFPTVENYPKSAPRTDAEPKATPLGVYPEILTERKLEGAVAFACVVTAEGRVENPRITGATHVEFVLPALEAMRHWEFSPALQGELPVSSNLEAKVTFNSMGDSREEILAANHLTAPGGGTPESTPEPISLSDEVWPLERLLKGEGGHAVIEFTVDINSLTSGIKVKEASQPEFGCAAAAAVETWAFTPPVSGGRRMSVPLEKRFEFKPIPAGQESAADPFQRLVAALRADTVGSAVKLDEKLTPIYRVAPIYPSAFNETDRPAGRAEIEFIIDREGRARLPRILSATREEFGWSAATAVNQWVFQPPRRGGEAVDVKIKIPFEFAAPIR